MKHPSPTYWYEMPDKQPWLTPDRHNWHKFERALIEAQTVGELQAAKLLVPVVRRYEVMAAWRLDGRYEWLAAKAQSLAMTSRAAA